MKISKSQLKQIIKEEIKSVLNEQDLADLVSSAIEQIPAGPGTEYKAVRNVLNQLASDPSEETMRKIISLAGKGRPNSISGVTLTAKTIGHPLLSAVATKLGPDHAVFRTNLGRYAKGYIKKLAELGMIQEAYTEKRLAKAMAQTMKDPGSYYYNLKSSSEDPSSYYSGEDNRPEEIKAINQIANRMYNLELMISQTKKMPERIQQVKQSIQQAASMEGAAAEEAKKAEQALQSLLQNMPKF